MFSLLKTLPRPSWKVSGNAICLGLLINLETRYEFFYIIFDWCTISSCHNRWDWILPSCNLVLCYEKPTWPYGTISCIVCCAFRRIHANRAKQAAKINMICGHVGGGVPLPYRRHCTGIVVTRESLAFRLFHQVGDWRRSMIDDTVVCSLTFQSRSHRTPEYFYLIICLLFIYHGTTKQE